MKVLENWLFNILLKRYVTYDLDQWELFKIKTQYGKVYISFSRQPLSGEDKHYNELE